MKKRLAILLVICLVLSGCNLYREPPGVNTRPTESETAETTEATAESLSTTEPTGNWEELLTYAEYLEMTAEERAEFSNSFEDSAQFFEWFREVKAIYDEQRKENEMNQDGIIDMDQINPNS